MTKMRRLATTMLALSLAAGWGGSAAFAATATTAGAKTTNSFTTTQDLVRSYDTANDSQWVSAGWKSNWGSEGSFTNKQGFNTNLGYYVTSGGEKVSQIRACRSNTLLPMSCGSWVSTGR